MFDVTCVNCEVSLDVIQATPSMSHPDRWRCSDVYACHVRLIESVTLERDISPPVVRRDANGNASQGYPKGGLE